MRPLLLDLFCGAGGAAMGYHRAGFDVVGVDIEPQPRYPFRFVKADALEVLKGKQYGWAFDAIHASPPCQAYSILNAVWKNSYPDLVAATRVGLEATGLPYIIENVERAPLHNALQLCGSSFGLITEHKGRTFYLQRHRRFESNRWLYGLPCVHGVGRQAGGVYGSGEWSNEGNGHRGGYQMPKDAAARLMGIDWMTKDELAEAIPPAYTEFIGEQLLRSITTNRESRIATTESA